MRYSIYRKWRQTMPSFHKSVITITGSHLEEIDTFQVEAKPLGFRGIWGLSWLLHLTPYITGSRPKFRISVKRLGNSSNPFQLAMRRIGGGHDYLILKTKVIEGNTYSETFQHDEPISNSGEYSYVLQLAESQHSQPEAELVSFSAQIQENITMWGFGFLAAFLAAGFGSLITWAFTRGGH